MSYSKYPVSTVSNFFVGGLCLDSCLTDRVCECLGSFYWIFGVLGPALWEAMSLLNQVPRPEVWELALC